MLLPASLLLFVASSLAGEVLIDVRVPARIALDGAVLGEVYEPGRLVVQRDPGRYALVATIGGEPWRQEIVVPATGNTRVLISSRGITPLDAPDPAETPSADAAAQMTFEVSTAGSAGLMLIVDGRRHRVSATDVLELPLGVGHHSVDVRSLDGAVVYTRGVLKVTEGGRGLLHLVEGAAPEASGDGVSFAISGG